MTGVVYLGDYPFYMEQPTAEMNAVFAKWSPLIREALGDHLESIATMGSSSLIGMPGTPVVDILIQVNTPYSDELHFESLKALGFFKPPFRSGHDVEDEWFWGGEGNPGCLGRVVLHIVPAGNKFARQSIAFTKYLNSNREAFERYRSVKLEGIQAGLEGQDGQRVTTYKGFKSATCLALLEEALRFYEESQDE